MKRTLTALTVAASLIASGVSAHDSKTLEVLENLSKVAVEDLYLGLSQRTLKEKNEMRERLRSAQEDWENHPKAEIDLSSAKLRNAYLPDIELRGADLSGADLSNSTLTNADLTNADLTNADLSGAVLSKADLTRTTMKGVILCNTTMPSGAVIYSGC